MSALDSRVTKLKRATHVRSLQQQSAVVVSMSAWRQNEDNSASCLVLPPVEKRQDTKHVQLLAIPSGKHIDTRAEQQSVPYWARSGEVALADGSVAQHVRRGPNLVPLRGPLSSVEILSMKKVVGDDGEEVLTVDQDSDRDTNGETIPAVTPWDYPPEAVLTIDAAVMAGRPWYEAEDAVKVDGMAPSLHVVKTPSAFDSAATELDYAAELQRIRAETAKGIADGSIVEDSGVVTPRVVQADEDFEVVVPDASNIVAATPAPVAPQPDEDPGTITLKKGVMQTGVLAMPIPKDELKSQRLTQNQRQAAIDDLINQGLSALAATMKVDGKI